MDIFYAHHEQIYSSSQFLCCITVCIERIQKQNTKGSNYKNRKQYKNTNNKIVYA